MRHQKMSLRIVGLVVFVLTGILVGSTVFAVHAMTLNPPDPRLASVAASDLACVNATGTGCHPDCGGCFASVQAAVDAVPPGGYVRVAEGTYTGVGLGPVVAINKGLSLTGGFDAACGTQTYGETILDGENTRTVVKVENTAGLVDIAHFTFTRGTGEGNCDDIITDYEGCGGGMYVKNARVLVTNNIFRDNIGSTSGTGAGGGAFVDNAQLGSATEFSECTFTNNVASAMLTGWGGGLFLDAGTALTHADVLACQFSGNAGSTKYEGYGGGAYVSGYVDMDTDVFVANHAGRSQALWGYGGGLYVWQAKALDLTNSTFRENVAVESPAQFSVSAGGAIYASTNITMTVINNIIVRNEALDDGSAVLLESTDLGLPVNAWFWHNTMVGNLGSSTSGAITLGDNVGVSHAHFTNNIIAGHARGIDVINPSDDVVTADTNCLWNTDPGFTGTNALLADPKLTPEYYPQVGSPVIEAGVLLTGHPALASDKDEVGRPLGAFPNIGAYEKTRYVNYLPVAFRK
jgi:hypothetical protein